MSIQSKSVIFVGDPHFDATAPSSRIDDYAQTAISKMLQVKSIAIEQGAKVVVMLGDTFTRSVQPTAYITHIMRLFKSFVKEGISLYTIVGSHCVPYDRMENLDRSAIGLLLESDLISMLSDVSVQWGDKSLHIKGFSYLDDIIPAEHPSSVCVAHRFFEFSFDKSSSLTKEDLEKLGYTYYIFGHDHNLYPMKQVGNSVLVRPGSLMRNTAHQSSLNRDVVVSYIDLSCNPTKVGYLKLDVLPSNQVFTQSVIDEEKGKKVSILKKSAESIESLLEQVSFSYNSRDKNHIFQVLEDMPVGEEVKDRLRYFLNLKFGG